MRNNYMTNEIKTFNQFSSLIMFKLNNLNFQYYIFPKIMKNPSS